ncbi:hypothetical protein I4U23_016758 [Adineta vaga]|nr:hypothetical protein I4U23_016758 [Adineta vaga]
MNNVLEEIWENEVIRSSLFDSKSLDKKLIELCLQLPKLETIEEKGSDIIIIWFKNQHEKILTDLRINIFYSYDELTAFLSELKTNNVFLIIDQSMLLHILPYLDNLLQIIFIYIYKDTEIYNPVPTVDCKRTFRKISNNQDELSHSIQEDIEICRKDSLSTSLFDLIVQEESTDQTKNMSFIWYHLLINSLFDSGVYHKTAKTDFINYCRQQYLDNKTGQNTITEFENKYSSIDAIRWYTRDSFVYRLLNKSLRTRNIDIIFKLRFFIIDLQNQLEQFYNEESMKSIPFVYHGQEISDVELDKLKTSVGKYISINTYFSASQNQRIAENFAIHPTAILFEIDIQNVISMKNKRIRPVNIQDKSYFPDELEIIFPIGSIFKVDSIDIDNSPRRIRLILTEDEDYERMFEIFQKNYVMKLPSSVLFADLLISMGEYHKAKQYLHILIEELNLSNDMINNGYAYCSMGKIYDANALNLIEKDNAFCARIYLYIGRLYRNKNEYDTALKYCHKALNYQHAMDSSDLADLYDEFGSIYSQMQNFDQTVKYLNQSLNIRQSNQSNYREYISTYISLIILYLKKSDYHETLQRLKDILHILINTVPQGHPDIVFIYTCVGIAYRKCEDYESAMIYCQKALRTIENLSQKQNVNATTYILLYITLSDLNDHANDRLFYAQSAFDIYVKLKNILPERNPIAFDMYNQMGIAYFHLFNFNSALNYFFYALEFSSEADKRCLILFHIARTYIEKGDCKMALQYLNKSHQISLELNHQVTNYRRLAEIYSDYSRVYEIENNLEKSIFYVEERLKLNETNNDSLGLANDYERLVKLHPDKKNIYVQKLVEIIQKNDLCPTDKYAYHMILAYYFERQNDLTSALEYHNLSLKYQLTIIPPCYHNLILTYSTIGFIYKKIQDFDNALDYFEKSCHMYVKLSNLSRPSLKDQKIMLMNERYIIENVNQCSLLTSTILLTYNNIAYIYMHKKNNENVLKYVRKAHEIIEDYQGKKELISKQEFYYALATGQDCERAFEAAPGRACCGGLACLGHRCE